MARKQKEKLIMNQLNHSKRIINQMTSNTSAPKLPSLMHGGHGNQEIYGEINKLLHQNINHNS